MGANSPLLIKHPFIYLYHYIVIILNSVGFSSDTSVIILSQVFHSSSLVISFFIFRCMGRPTLESTLLTIGLSGTSTYMSTGLVLDVYSLSIFWISAIFWIVCNAISKKTDCSVWLRAIVSIMAIGTTTYLVILVLLMELVLIKQPDRGYIESLKNSDIYKQLLRIFSLGILLFLFVYFQVIFDVIQDPVGILKRVFWTVNRPGEKEGILQVIAVFSIFSILSPTISNITLPEGISMIDLRVMEFGYIGWIGIVILSVALLLKCKNNEHRVILIFSLSWLIFNLLFHTVYQYRGSLFLYCGHFIMAVWILFVTKTDASNVHSRLISPLINGIDKVIVYMIPFIIWGNNVYLYNNILDLVN